MEAILYIYGFVSVWIITYIAMSAMDSLKSIASALSGIYSEMQSIKYELEEMNEDD